MACTSRNLGFGPDRIEINLPWNRPAFGDINYGWCVNRVVIERGGIEIEFPWKRPALVNTTSKVEKYLSVTCRGFCLNKPVKVIFAGTVPVLMKIIEYSPRGPSHAEMRTLVSPEESHCMRRYVGRMNLVKCINQ
jgi:hypothetical protein